MYTYKTYLEKKIAESAVDGDIKDILMEKMESANTVSELDSIEALLENSVERISSVQENRSSSAVNLQLDIFEAFESGNITEDDRDTLLAMLEEADAKELTLKEQQDASGATTASDDGKTNNNEYEISGFADLENALENGIAKIGDGDLEKGYKLVLKASEDAVKTYIIAIDKLSDKDGIKEDIDDIKAQTKELEDECKSGEITASSAKTKANKIRVKVKLVGKKIKAAMSKGGKNEKPTTESALESIFEGASDGYLEDSDVTFLVNAITK